MTELVEVKARRLLAAGAVTVHAVSPTRVVAHVAGDHDRYAVTWGPVVGWGCTCADLHGRCSHLAATQLVTCRQPDQDPTAVLEEATHAVA